MQPLVWKMNKTIVQKKLFWITVILFDMGLLIYGFLANDWFLSLLALVLVLVIKRYGYDLLFKKYDEEWDQKHQEYVEKKRRYQKNG